MKGKILGFNEVEGSGAISAEDGSRHSFIEADWRGQRPPQAGMTVDFESADGAAKEIYPVTSGAMAALGSMNTDLGGLSGSPEGARIAAMLTGSLAAPLALVVIAACFMSAITSPMMSVNLIDLGKVLDGLNFAGAAASIAGEQDSGAGAAGALLMLRFVAPLSALWLIWAAWSGKHERAAMLVTGIAAIGAGLLVIGLRSSALSMLPDFVRAEASEVINLGLGTWVLLASGAALVAAFAGKLRNPLAKV